MLPIYSASNSFAADANSWQMLTQTLPVPLPIWVQNIIWRKHTGWEVGLWCLLLRTRSAEKCKPKAKYWKTNGNLQRTLAGNPKAPPQGWPVQWGRVRAWLLFSCRCIQRVFGVVWFFTSPALTAVSVMSSLCRYWMYRILAWVGLLRGGCPQISFWPRRQTSHWQLEFVFRFFWGARFCPASGSWIPGQFASVAEGSSLRCSGCCEFAGRASLQLWPRIL